MKHSNFSPSRLERIILCPGSVQLATTIPDPPTSPAAQAGILCHQATDEAMNIGLNQITYIDDDQKDMVQDCLDYKQSIISSFGHTEYTEASEIRVNLSAWGVPEVWGTLDLAISNNILNHLHIVDWKFGYNWVNVFENPQLLAYAAGYVGWPTKFNAITLHVCQPAVENFSKFKTDVDELRDWVHSKLAKAIALAQSKNPPLNPGEVQCKWCPNAATCRARYIQAQEDAARIFAAAQNLPKNVTKEEIAEALDSADRYTAYAKSLYGFAVQELEHGRSFPGKKLVRGKSNRKWKQSETKTALWLGQNTEIEDIYKSKLISPAQAEKLDKTLKKNSAFAMLYEKPLGKTKMVSLSDPRPSVNPSCVATSVFADFDPEKKS